MPDPTRREAARAVDAREALECAEYALTHPASDQGFALAAVRAALDAYEQAMAGEPEDFGPRLNTLLDDLYRLVPEAASPPGDDRPPEQRVVAALQARLEPRPLTRADVERVVAETMRVAGMWGPSQKSDRFMDAVWSRLTEGEVGMAVGVLRQINRPECGSISEGAWCQTCGWQSTARNAVVLAGRHARGTGHEVTAEKTLAYRWSARRLTEGRA